MTDVFYELSRARAEAQHWKSNHDAQVQRARFLIERGDIPIERVRAYETMTQYHDALQRASMAAGLVAGDDVTEKLVSRIWMLRELLWNASAFAKNKNLVLPFQDYVDEFAGLSTDHSQHNSHDQNS
jgi:hypothetical protein